MSIEAYGDEGNVGCEECVELESRLEELEERGAMLQAFYELAAKIECEGKCGKHQPVLQDNTFGQRSRNGEWLCGPCHSAVCGVDVTLEEHRYHSCGALRWSS